MAAASVPLAFALAPKALPRKLLADAKVPMAVVSVPLALALMPKALP
jgi:hypothetical protein